MIVAALGGAACVAGALALGALLSSRWFWGLVHRYGTKDEIGFVPFPARRP